MSEELVDKNQRPFGDGIYTTQVAGEREYFRVSNSRGEWQATDGRETYKLAYPPNLPDSSIMPEGQLDASELVRVEESKIPKILEELSREKSKIQRRISLLTQSQPKLTNSPPQFPHYQEDAPPCDVCGSPTVRNGNCYKCYNCGSTSGCS